MARRWQQIGVLAMLLGFAAILGPWATQGQAAHPPVTVRLAHLGQFDLVNSGRLTLRLGARRTVRVRVSASLRSREGRRVLASPRALLLRKGQGRMLELRLRLAARGALSGCVPRRVVVTVESRKGRSRLRRRASAPLALQPPACGRFFGAHSVWNSPLPAGAPLDPQSSSITSELLREVARSYSSPPYPTINTTAYSTPIYTVTQAQPRTRVKLDQPPGYAPHLESRFASVPMPPNAQPAPGSDAHMVVWQPSTDTLWEFWQMRRTADGWHALWGGRLDDVSSGPGHFSAPVANLGATATSLPLVGGLITAAELRSGRIDHALAIAVPNARRGAYARPAQRSDGASSASNSVPEGARFRLDPALDIDGLGLPPATRAMARAAQRYGVIVRDQSAVVAFYGEDPAPLGTNPYPALFGGAAPWDLLRGFPWSHLQLLQMDLVQSPARDPGSIICGILRCS